MKIQTKTSRKKTIIASIVTILAMFLGTATYAYLNNIGPFEKDYNTQPASDEEKAVGSDIKKDSIERTGTDSSNEPEKNSGEDLTPEPTPNNNGGKPTVGMEITSANQNGATVQIRSLIQTVSASGSCTIEVSDSNQSIYTAKAEVQAMPHSTTCKGFDIPVSELSTGKWKIDITFENQNVTGTATKEVTVQ